MAGFLALALACSSYYSSTSDPRPTLLIRNKSGDVVAVHDVATHARIATVFPSQDECVRITISTAQAQSFALSSLDDSAETPPELLANFPGWSIDIEFIHGGLQYAAVSLQPAPRCVPRGERPQ